MTTIAFVAMNVLALLLVGCAATGLLKGIWDFASPMAAEKVAETLLKEEPPLSTSIADATFEVPLLDNFKPSREVFIPMEMQPLENNSGYRLSYGLYSIDAQSYCVQAGTHGPSVGDGYVYAPLAGARAPVIRDLLRNTLQANVSQHDIQVLLWAILARTKLSDMSVQDQRTAATLLSKKELFELNGGALGLIPDEVLRAAIGHLPPVAQQIYYKEQQMRQLLTSKKSTSYAQLESLAVLAGVAPAEYKIRDIPSGRWSYHPKGYFVRYFPSGYQQTRFEAYRPVPFKVERDAWGRITALDNDEFIRVETTYRQAGTHKAQAIKGLLGHQLREIRLTMGTPGTEKEGETLRIKESTSAWTLVEATGAATKDGAAAPSLDRQRKEALRRREAMASLRGPSNRDLAPESQREILDVASYVDAIRGALKGKKPWVSHALLVLEQAPHAMVASKLGGAAGAQTSASSFSVGSGANTGDCPEDTAGTAIFEPTENVLVPANTYGQRLISAGRPVNARYDFSNKVELNEGECPISVRETYGDKGSHWDAKPASAEGHQYLALNSLGESQLSPSELVGLLKYNVGYAFPFGDASTPDGRPQTVEKCKLFKLPGPRFLDVFPWLTFGNFVRVTRSDDFSWTFKAVPGMHNFQGTVDFGVCRDPTGELWLFQEGYGVSGESKFKQWVNNKSARVMWEKMAENTKDIIWCQRKAGKSQRDFQLCLRDPKRPPDQRPRGPHQ